MRPDKIATLKVCTAVAFEATVHQSLCGMSSFFARRSPLVFGGSLAYDETKEGLTTEFDDAELGVRSTHLSVFCCNQRCQCFLGKLLSERNFSCTYLIDLLRPRSQSLTRLCPFNLKLFFFFNRSSPLQISWSHASRGHPLVYCTLTEMDILVGQRLVLLSFASSLHIACALSWNAATI